MDRLSVNVGNAPAVADDFHRLRQPGYTDVVSLAKWESQQYQKHTYGAGASESVEHYPFLSDVLAGVLDELLDSDFVEESVDDPVLSFLLSLAALASVPFPFFEPP